MQDTYQASTVQKFIYEQKASSLTGRVAELRVSKNSPNKTSRSNRTGNPTEIQNPQKRAARMTRQNYIK